MTLPVMRLGEHERAAAEALAVWLRERSGLVFQGDGLVDLWRGVERWTRQMQVEDSHLMVAQLMRGSLGVEGLLDEVTVGESYFFREVAHYRFLEDQVAGLDLGPSVWSAGCSSGEEIYSVAMLLSQRGLLPTSRLVASDVAPRALTRAREATYRPWALRTADSRRAIPFLERKGGMFEVLPAIRQRVQFVRLNLVTSPYPSDVVQHFDFIFCRNVLIYVAPERLPEVAQKLWASLRPGGFLLMASTDPPLGSLAPFVSVHGREALIYQRPEDGQTEARVRGVREPTPAARPLRSVAPPPTARSSAPIPEARPSAPIPEATPSAPIPASLPPASWTLPPPAAAPEFEAVPAPAAAALELADVRLLADRGATEEALARCEALTARFSDLGEAHFVEGLLRLERRDVERAVRSLSRSLYLEPGQIFAHFTLASALEGRGDRQGAARALRTVLRLGSQQPPDAPVAWGPGVTVRELLDRAARWLGKIDKVRDRDGG